MKPERITRNLVPVKPQCYSMSAGRMLMSLLEWMSDEARHGKALEGLLKRYFK